MGDIVEICIVIQPVEPLTMQVDEEWFKTNLKKGVFDLKDFHKKTYKYSTYSWLCEKHSNELAHPTTYEINIHTE